MTRSNLIATLLTALSCATYAGAQTFAPSSADPNILVPASSVPRPGRIHTDYLVLNQNSPNLTMHPFSSAPAGYAPADIRRAYNIPPGGGDAIAIVDAYDLASSLPDFNTFAQQFGLPQESSSNPLAASNNVFEVVYASGTKPPDGAANAWGGEIALDIEWSHAMAPNAKIYLVEANSDSSSDLFGAAKVAAALPNVHEVSMSWGSDEYAGENLLDSTFTHSGVVYFASSGDSSAQEYPSESPNLISVGGTSLNVSQTAYVNEVGWSGGGGGPSSQEPRPHFQDVIQSVVGSVRGDPDCSAVADPNTGVAVFSSEAFPGQGDWITIGGTSLACPVVAGITNNREFAENSFAANSNEEEQRIYGNLMGCFFRDITSGSSFSNCEVGWDFVTGVGTPNGLMPAWSRLGGGVEKTANGANASAGHSQRWADTASAGIEGSAVTSVGDLVYFGADDDNLYAVNSIDGSLDWQFATSGKIASAPAVGSDGTVYAASEDGNLYALNGTSGDLLWKFTAGGEIDSSPAISTTGSIYFGCEDGKVYALNLSGTQEWTFTGAGSFESSPVIDPSGNLEIGSDGDQLFSITPSGVLNWSVLTDGPVKSSPAIGPNGLVFAGSEDSNVYAIDFANGAIAWKFLTGGKVDSSPAVSQTDVVYIGSADTNLYSLNAFTGTESWKFQTGGAISSSPAIDTNGVVYVGSSDDKLYAVQSTGVLDWSFPTGGSVGSVSLGGDGTIYFGSLDHKLYALGGSTLAGFSVAPSLVTGGTTATGTVELVGPASADGVTVALSSSGDLATVPASVRVAGGQSLATFSVSTASVTTTQTVTITASLLGGTTQTVLTLEPSPFANFYLSASSVTGGTGLNGVVQLQSSATGSGQAVSLSSNNSSVSLPSQVTVANGSKGVSFAISSFAVSTIQTVTLGATIGSSEATATLVVNPTPLTSFYLSTNSVIGQTGLRGVVRLAGNAGPSGNVITLLRGNPCVAVPANVTIPAGSTAVSFAISTAAVSSVQTVTLTASFGETALQSTLTVNPYALSSFTISPTKLVGRNVAYGVLRLTGPAGPTGDAVSLSSNESFVIPPATVTVPAGKSAVSFAISTTAVGSPLFATLTASFNKVSLIAGLNVSNAPIASFTLSPATVVGGNASHAILRLTGPAGAPDNYYNISTSNEASTSIANVVLAIPAGSTAASFVIGTSGVASTQTSTINIVGPDGGFATQTLTITPAVLTNFYFSPSTLKGGASTTGVLQLNGQAPPGSINVSLSGNNNEVLVPPTPIQIFQGKTAATFSIQPAKVQSNTTVTVNATYNGVTLRATVTVTP